MARIMSQFAKNEPAPTLESISGNGIPTKERGIQGYKYFVTAIMRHNSAVEDKDSSAYHPVREYNEENWLREQMKDRWARRRETNAWEEFRAYKADVQEANRRRIESGEPLSRADQKWERVEENKLKRTANKKMWEECKQAVLKDWGQESGHDYNDKVEELLGLQAMVDVQRAELNARTKTPQQSISEAISRTQGLAEMVDSHLRILDTQVDTTKALLELSSKSMRRIQTRVSRLAARDVRDEEIRKDVMQERLAHPEALRFMFEGQNDLEAAKAVTDSTRRFMETMEEDWEKVSLAAVDTISELKDAILAMDLHEGEANG